ncbi:MAG: thiamine-phosphate synthase family protein [Thermoproteota archaeon]
MAKMLLTALRSNPSMRAAINMKYDLNIEKILSDMGHEVGRTVRNDKVSGSDDLVLVAC